MISEYLLVIKPVLSIVILFLNCYRWSVFCFKSFSHSNFVFVLWKRALTLIVRVFTRKLFVGQLQSGSGSFVIREEWLASPRVWRNIWQSRIWKCRNLVPVRHVLLHREAAYRLQPLGHYVCLVEVIIHFKIGLLRKFIPILLVGGIPMAAPDVNVISGFMKFPDGVLLDVDIQILISPQLL